MSLQLSNRKKYLLGILFIGWLALSFLLPYYLITNHLSPKWIFFSSAFLYYLVYFQIISTLGFAYLITNGHLSEAKKHIKLIIVFTSILIVFAFTSLRWATLTTSYGQYGHYVKGTQSELFFSLKDGEGTAFERETIHREGLAQKYDIAFKQIWTFGAFVFFSTLLLLMALDRKEHTEK